MSNLPILYFTLGALAGLPIGYRVAQTWYEIVEPLLLALASVYCIERQVHVLMDAVGALQSKEAA